MHSSKRQLLEIIARYMESSGGQPMDSAQLIMEVQQTHRTLNRNLKELVREGHLKEVRWCKYALRAPDESEA